jgi:YHS domain-containing protein
MSGLLSFLLFGALFFFMMRFGCGSHAGHGGHANHHHEPGSDGPIGSGQQALTAGIDPVCGMKVDADMGYLKMFRGKSYRLCSRDCLDKFEAEPDRYVAQPGSGQGGQPS